jgi:hypothetical protein
MIQRIQSIYLLSVAGIMLAMLFLPIASMYESGGGASCTFRADGIYPEKAGEAVSANYALFGLILFTAIHSIAAVFLFRKRLLQIKLTHVNCILMLLVYAGIFGYGQYFISGTDYTVIPEYAILFPLVSVIIAQLAVRSIRRDEKLVRSLDRIR